MADAAAAARRLVWWLVPFAIVVAALGFETDWGRYVSRVEPVRATAPTQPVAVALMPEYRIDGGLDARKETVDRVLFNPTRRPAPAALQGAAAPSAMKRGQFTLTGTTVVGNVATAFLREVNGGKSRSVRRGETLNGMLVAEVAPDHVRLKQGDEFEELQLKIAAGPRTTVQPAPVTAAAPAHPAAGQPTAAGTSPGGAGSRVPTRPVAPPAAASQGAPQAAPQRTTPVSVSEILAERRRAARAAAEAAAAGRSPVKPAPQR